jgi:hypothetical protein
MKRKKGIIITVFFAFIFISLLSANRLFADEGSKEANTKKTETSRAQTKVIGAVVRGGEDYKGEGLRDPFKDYFDTMPPPPPVVGEEGENLNVPLQTLPTLQVQGIILGGRLNQAIINNKIVKVGDSIEGVRVTTIEKDGVTVFFGNRSYNISSPAAGTLQGAKKKPEGGSDEK